MKMNILTNKYRLILFILLVSSTLPASAQHYLGVRGGFGGGTSRFEPVKEDLLFWGMPSFGFTWRYRGGPKYVGAIQADLQYQQQGFERADNKDSDTSYRRTINSVFLPFMWQPNVQLWRGHAEVFLNLGVYLCYNIDSHEEWRSKKKGVWGSQDYPLQSIRDNRMGYGLTGGIGLGIYQGRFEFLAEFRYSYGYSDILKNTTKYDTNPRRSPLDQLNFSLGVMYRISGNKKRLTAPTPAPTPTETKSKR